jgi:hypothetical protein
MQTEEAKKESKNIKVCIRFRPLFANEQKNGAAPWNIDRDRKCIKVQEIFS